MQGRSLRKLRVGRYHLLVQHTHNANSAGLQPVKHGALALFVPVEPRTDCISGPAYSGVLRKELETLLQNLGIPSSRIPAHLSNMFLAIARISDCAGLETLYFGKARVLP